MPQLRLVPHVESALSESLRDFLLAKSSSLRSPATLDLYARYPAPASATDRRAPAGGDSRQGRRARLHRSDHASRAAGRVRAAYGGRRPGRLTLELPAPNARLLDLHFGAAPGCPPRGGESYVK